MMTTTLKARAATRRGKIRRLRTWCNIVFLLLRWIRGVATPLDSGVQPRRREPR
jgi:hypothetical protein